MGNKTCTVDTHRYLTRFLPPQKSVITVHHSYTTSHVYISEHHTTTANELHDRREMRASAQSAGTASNPFKKSKVPCQLEVQLSCDKLRFPSFSEQVETTGSYYIPTVEGRSDYGVCAFRPTSTKVASFKFLSFLISQRTVQHSNDATSHAHTPEFDVW